MRKVIIMFALAMGIITANAQENVTVETTNGSEQPTLTKEVYPQKEADGDLYHGLSRKLTFDRMIPPHGLEVTYDKTVHVKMCIRDSTYNLHCKYCYQHSQADQFLLHWSLPPFPNYCSIDTSTACTRYLRLSIPA